MDAGPGERFEGLGVEATARGDAQLEVAERGGALHLVSGLAQALDAGRRALGVRAKPYQP